VTGEPLGRGPDRRDAEVQGQGGQQQRGTPATQPTLQWFKHPGSVEQPVNQYQWGPKGRLPA
jgi:hypothetical protein